MPVMEYLKAWGEENLWKMTVTRKVLLIIGLSLGFPVMWVILCEEPGLSMDGMGMDDAAMSSSGVEARNVAMGAEYTYAMRGQSRPDMITDVFLRT